MARVLVVDAGASVEEGLRAGLAAEQRLPLVRDFPKIWARQFSPDPRLLADYLASVAQERVADPFMAFKALAAQGDPRINVERFFEFAWLRRRAESQSWEATVHSAIFIPIVLQMAHFIEQLSPTTLRQFVASQSVARKLKPGDLIVNLNYDTVLEIGLKQARMPFQYAPTLPRSHELWLAKPHGSINLILTQGQGRWLDPEMFQTVTYPDEDMAEFRGIVPPRYNKSFAQHETGALICDAIRGFTAEAFTLWGVSLADSDLDLLDLYGGWTRNLAQVELIHPNPRTESKGHIESLLRKPVRQFSSPEEWAAAP